MKLSILIGTRNLSFLKYVKCIKYLFYVECNHLVCLVMEVGYISFSFHLFKVKFSETLLSCVIYPLSIRCTCTINQKTLSVISSDDIMSISTQHFVM